MTETHTRFDAAFAAAPLVAIAAAVFGLCAWSLAAAFRRRAGVAMKVR